MVANPKDPNGYQRKFEREKQIITERDDETGEWRVSREQDRKDLRLYASSVLDRVDYSCAFNYLGRLRRLAEVLDKPLRNCDVDDIKLGMQDLAEKNLGEGESYTAGTRRQYLRTVEDFGDERDINALSDIDVPSVTQEKVDEETVLSKAEVWELLEAADKTRTKAIIATCWECAWRVTALLSLKVRDYEEVNDEYALLSAPIGVTGDKGAGGNTKPLTIARGYLDNWLANHPASDDLDAALFCRTDKKQHYGEHMTGEAVRKQLNRAAEAADIDRDRVYVHSFRHARTTYMKKSPEYSDMDIEHTLDWTDESNQMKRYSHLDQDDKIASVLRARGIEAEGGDVDPEFMDCPRCNRQIPWDARNCPYCTVRVDETPAKWFQLYSKVLVEPEDDPVYSKYAGISSATPSLPRLSKSEFQRVTSVLQKALAAPNREILEVLPDDLREYVGDVDASELTDDEMQALVEMSSRFPDLVENYELNETEYELTTDEVTLSHVRERAGQADDK